jgi:hypothetical protein
MESVFRHRCPVSIKLQGEVNVLVIGFVRRHSATKLRPIQDKCFLMASVPNRKYGLVRSKNLRGVSIPDHGEVIEASFNMKFQ